MSDSLAFDRAAGYYDRTRALSPEARRRVVELLTSYLPRGERVLEIGVGTGRIALPLHGRGIDMVGVDISAPMLRKLVANAGERAPFPIALADATRLALADDSCGGAVAAHVLHLIPAWREAVDELFRVLRPGAALLVDMGGDASREGDWAEIMRRFVREAGITQRHRGADRIDEITSEMEGRGASAAALEPIENLRSSTYAGLLDGLAEGLWSITWQVDDTTRRGAAERTGAWATKRFGDPSARVDIRDTVSWHAYRLP